MPFYLKNNKVKNYNTSINKYIIPNYINTKTYERLYNKNYSTDRFIYSYQDPYYNGIGQFIRNPNCWLNGISNISCFSPAQLSGADWRTRAGTLITKKHVLFAKHYTPGIISGGTPLIFVDENNNVIRRNIISYGYDSSTDIAIGLLDSEVPSNIKIAKVLPKNFTNYINNNIIGSSGGGLDSFRNNPILYGVGIDQEEKAIVKIFAGCDWYGSGDPPNTVYFQQVSAQNVNAYTTTDPYNQQFVDWSENIVVGDSGNPFFIIIDNELVVLTTWWTPSGGPFITSRYDNVNTIINTLSPGENYSLTDIDLQSIYNKISRPTVIKKTNSINKLILSNHINTKTTERLYTKNSSTDRFVYSYQDPYYNGVGQFVRNPSCWLNGVSNISCASPAQLSGADWRTRAGTLITTKHILQAKHYTTSILPNGGTPIIFVDDNNNVIRRNLISYAYDDSDIAIGLLDQDVPSNIKIAKVLPTNFTDYISSTINADGSVDLNPLLYAVGLDQEEKANLKIFYNIYKYTTNLIASGYAYMAYVSDFNILPSAYATMNPQPTIFSAFNEPTVVGDSGNPIFLIIDNQLVILTTWWGTSNGPFVTYKYDTINSLINTLSPNEGYSLTPIDLQAVYNKYS